MVIVLLPGMYLRFESLRTRETLLEARRVREDALIVWGTARRDRYDIGLREGSVLITGTLWDRIAPGGLVRRRCGAVPHAGRHRLRRAA